MLIMIVALSYTIFRTFLPTIIRNYEGKPSFGEEALETLNICLLFWGMMTSYGPNLMQLTLGFFDFHRRNFIMD